VKLRPPLFPLMPVAPLGLLATAAVASVATWRHVRRLERQLLGQEHSGRSPQEVLDHHLALAREGDLGTDLQRNYHPDIVLLTSFGTYRRHEGVRTLTRRLNELAPDATFDYHDVQVEGDVGFLQWSGRATNGTLVLDGADSYVIREGRIVAQTIHYRTEDGDRRGQR
jgi:hypothetical protein